MPPLAAIMLSPRRRRRLAAFDTPRHAMLMPYICCYAIITLHTLLCRHYADAIDALYTMLLPLLIFAHYAAAADAYAAAIAFDRQRHDAIFTLIAIRRRLFCLS